MKVFIKIMFCISFVMLFTVPDNLTLGFLVVKALQLAAFAFFANMLYPNKKNHGNKETSES